MFVVKQLVFAIVVLAAFTLFIHNVSRFVRVAMLGRPANLHETWGQRIGSLLKYFFGQRKVMERSSSWHHLVIYWGFLVLTVATTEMLISGLVGHWFDLGVLVGDTIHGYVRLFVDVANALVAVAVLWALFRRLVIRPPFVPPSLDALLILGAILALVLTHYGHHVWQTAASGTVDPMMPVATWVGQTTGIFAAHGIAVTARFDPTWSHTASEGHWWGHMLIILGFLNYLPFSKHIHVLGSAPNILMRPLGPKGVMPKLELFDGSMDDPEAEPLLDNWGVGKIEDFSWKSLMDNYACTECARCTTHCPAFATEKPLSPMHLIHDLKDEMRDRGMRVVELARLKAAAGEPEGEDGDGSKAAPHADRIAELEKELEAMAPLVGGRIQDSTLWSCTTCGACQQVCPVFIDHPLKILQMRSHIVLNDETGRTPGELTRTFDNIERSGNPWGLAQSERMQWAEGLDVPTVADKDDAEYLLFLGCAGAYSDTGKKASRALVRCLEAAGISYAVLGNDESCTGDSLRRGGDEFRFQMLARANIEMFDAAGVKKIITSCPHCYHTLKHEYPQLGGNYEVFHHTALLNDLIRQGTLKVEAALAKRVTYHDSCYLGRWNDIYEEPRHTVQQIVKAGGRCLELPRNREHGFCCGAGGARMWMEEEASKRVNVARVKEVVDAGAEVVAVACPFCKTMVSDGIKQLDKDEEVDVEDIAELVARSLPEAASAEPAEDERA